MGNTESVGPYATVLTYGANLSHVGSPLGGFTSGNNLPNPNLIPFTSTEMEYGLEFRLFQNRLGLDITYYDQKTTNDILDASISQSSGFNTTSVNVGKITNKGVEFLLTATPVRSSAITWDISLNFAKNNSKVVSLIGNQTQLFVAEPRTRTVAINHIVGYPYGMITGITQLRINLGFLIDFRAGGDIYSGTNVRMTQAGFTKQTLMGRAGEAPLTITGVVKDVAGGGGFKPYTKTLAPGEARNYWSQLGERGQENFVYDASFIKLRQITLGYTLPSKLFTNTPIRTLMLSFVARNLAILYKNVPNIDPESSYSSGNAQGLDYFGMPASRTYGVNLRATF